MLGGDMTASLAAGLPNITGTVRALDQSHIRGFGNFSGAFKSDGSSISADYNPYTSISPAGFIFDASLSNPIYGNSNTVTPPSFNMIPQIKF